MASATIDQQLAEYGVLDEPGGRDLQALVDIAALVCDVPTAAINLISTDHQHQVATAGFDPSICLRADSMCAAVIDDAHTVVAEDASKDPRFADNPFVTGIIGDVRFYASAPLDTPDGTRIGRLCVFDEKPRRLDRDQEEVLRVLAGRVVDVLELRLRSRQLEQARDELRRSNELLTLFAGQVSHDLRSPLTAVLANTELLASEPAVTADPDASRLVEATLDAGRRMAGLIEAILEYARPGAALELGEVALEEVLADVRHDLAPLVERTGGSVTSGPLPRVRGDARQLHAVLQNLIGNALKYHSPGTAPAVRVEATPVDSRVDSVHRITVTDNGPGIPADRRDALFGLYARGEETVEGSGIGLATARRIVEAHGGRIGIEEAPGGGALIWFTVPAA